MASKHVVLMGDSTLDNVIWLDSYEECVKAKLQESLGEDVFISNYAADGFTTTNMIEGAVPALSHSAREETDPFPCPLQVFNPLEHLAELHKKKPVTHVVLSIGGNDIRVVLRSFERILQSMQKFLANYIKIVDECVKVTPKVIIMMQYRPSLYQDKVYGVYHAISQGSGGGKYFFLNKFDKESLSFFY